MRLQPVIREPGEYPNLPVIDREFDRFELNYDLEAKLREAETTAFYHDTLDPEE